MKKSSALLLVFLFFFEVILTMKVPNVDYKSSLKQTQNQLTQLLVQVESSEPTLSLSYVEESITKILNEITETQKRHRDISNRMHSQCNDERKFRDSEISDANVAFKASGDALANCQTSLEQATTYLPKLEEALRYFEELLKLKWAERKKYKEQSNKKKKTFKKAIRFVNNFEDLIREKRKLLSTGFSQITEKLIKHMTKVGKLKETAPIFVEITNKTIGDEQLSKILIILQDLKKEIYTDLQTFLKNERSDRLLFHKIQKEANRVIKQLKTNIEKTKSQIISMRICVSNESTIMYAASSKSSRNSKLLKLAEKTCVDFANEFITATKIRESELSMISQILEYVKKRFGEIDPKILQNLSNTSGNLRVYVNGHEFKAYQEYVKSKINDNLRGRALSNN